MRRMYTYKPLALPNEYSKIYCEQFVADELVLNNVEEGIYGVKLTQTDGDHVTYNTVIFDFKYESTYGSIFSSYFYDHNVDRIFALKGEYSGNSKTLTLVLIDTQGNVIQSPRSFHVDIYKLN